MAIALSVTLVVNSLSNTGFRSALIQRADDISDSLNTAWTIDLVRLTIIGLAIVAASPLIAQMFALPESTPILRLAGFSVILSGLSSIGTIYLRKELRAREELIIKLGSTVVNSVIAIALAFTLGSVWALAWGSMAGTIAGVVLSYVVYPYLPRFELRRNEIGWMFAFGKWMTVDRLAMVLANQAPRLGIAQVLGANALGMYVIGGRISMSLVAELNQISVRLVFPVLSKVQNNAVLLRRYSLAVVELGFAIVLPLSVFMAILAEEIVIGILGPNWESAVDITQILAIVAIPMVIVRLMRTPLQSSGHPGTAARVNLVPLAIIAIGIIPTTTRWGLEGAGWLVFSGYALAIVPLLITWRKSLNVAPVSFAVTLLPGLLIAMSIFGPLLLIKSLDIPNFIALTVGALTASLIYVVISYGIWRVSHTGPIALAIMVRTREKPSSD